MKRNVSRAVAFCYGVGSQDSYFTILLAMKWILICHLLFVICYLLFVICNFSILNNNLHQELAVVDYIF
jgi:hypothetical protein